MASYKSGFDPPTRPGDASRSRGHGAYIQPGMSRWESREEGIPQISGQTESKRRQAPAIRPHQYGLSPRPKMRDPSPGPNPTLETKPRGAAGSSFGFGRPMTKTTVTAQPPELKGKASRNVLRRKPSSIARQQSGGSRPPASRAGSSSPTKWSQNSAERRPSIESSLKSAEAYNEVFAKTKAWIPPVFSDSPQIIPELDRYRSRPDQDGRQIPRFNGEIPRLATQDLPPPPTSGTPGYSSLINNPNRYSGYSASGYSVSPSTRFSESPGPGAYSRDTTPTSMSSQSPGTMAPLKMSTPRMRQGSSPGVSRPPVTRRRAGSASNDSDGPNDDTQGLPALRESLNSSSSNSTVKGEAIGKEKEKKKKRLSPLPPSPPPRKSSQKFKNDRSEECTPTKAAKVPARPVMPSDPSPIKSNNVRAESQSKNVPPVRPSREGTPNLLSQQFGKSMAVIQSNLSSIPFSQERLQSGIALPRGMSPTSSRPQPGSKISSRGQSPNPVQASLREGTPAPPGLGIIPNLKPPTEPHPSTRIPASRTPSPSVANSKPRFGLFGRRTKTAPADVPSVENTEKVTRKGPAAGTGHEGYGRYGALRGRSTSAGPVGRGHVRNMSGASSSQESVASTRTHDPFLLERMSPVIIAGGGEVVENRNESSELSRTESNTSLLLDRPTIDSRSPSKTSLSHNAGARTTLWPSALPKDNSKRVSTLAIPTVRRRSDAGDDGMSKPSSLAFRRSIQRLNNSTGALNLPKPLNTGMGMSPSLKSLESSILSEESQLEAGRGRKGHLTKPRKLEKRPKSPRKWNFFHRSQPSPKPQVEALPVTVGRPLVKAVPHYALLDSSDEQQDPESMDIEDILRDADVIDLSNEELDALQFGTYTENLRRIDDLNMMMGQPVTEPERRPMLFTSPEPMQSTPELPQPEKFVVEELSHLQPAPVADLEPVSPPTDLHLTSNTAPTRPSRLAQVGRIPKVVSARPIATSPKSFSRPFARLSTVHPLLEPAILDKESIALGPSPPKPSTPEPFQQQPTGLGLEGLGLRKESLDSRADSVEPNHKDFLAFSPRKDSETMTTSSGGLSHLSTIAVIPEPDSALEEDEVWDEYDDIIENEATIKVAGSPTSSRGVPFQYESFETRRARKSKAQPKENLEAPAQGPSSPNRGSGFTTSSTHSADMAARMRDAFAAAPSPTTSMSFTDFFSGYGDRNISVQGDSARKPRRSSQNSSRKSGSSNGRKGSGAGFLTIAEQGDSQLSQVNLRVGSMTVSKWLTFGHVLFSPARDQLIQLEGSSKRHSILVIDGLGNDDWSFYAAETYPAATFYNLSPTRPLSASQGTPIPTFPLTPPNHRQVQYLSPAQRFPFPSSTFHVVVFRFPFAMSEASYRNIVAESKRVLKPGGYLEMAILDLDMLNMGNRSRRAVRGLKVQIQVADPNICLGSASDTVLRLVGKRGFNDVKSCNVGVPVASAIPEAVKQGEELSLADMMRDESRAGDEGITKMVAKVGRWWYTRCYEVGVIPDGNLSRSILNDGPLLSECEKWNASFKLVVAYAQKPIQGRRRTASV